MHLTDEEIVQEVLAGRKHSYAEIVTRYQQPVFNLMYRYTRHDQDAADLTQEVFLRAFHRLSTYRSDCSLFSWLYTLAVNRANDWSRSNKRRQENIQAFAWENGIPLQTENPAASMEKREEGERLQKALGLLSSETREILLLRYRHERPIREVATVFDLRESAVKMRIKRGLEQLQKILLEMHGHGTDSR